MRADGSTKAVNGVMVLSFKCVCDERNECARLVPRGTVVVIIRDRIREMHLRTHEQNMNWIKFNHLNRSESNQKATREIQTGWIELVGLLYCYHYARQVKR